MEAYDFVQHRRDDAEASQLKDGHTNAYFPEQIDELSKPPMRTGLVEGHVMIIEVMSPSLEDQGFHAGMEIVKVDEIPAVEYGKQSVEPFQSLDSTGFRTANILVRLSSRVK